MTRNKTTDLSNHLFEQLERLNNDELTKEEIDIELQRTRGIVSISNSIIANEKIQLDTAKTILEYGGDSRFFMPENLQIEHDKKG